MRAILTCTALVLLLSSACGDDLTTASVGSPAGSAPDLRLVVDTGGGFVPVEQSLADFPELVVDGTTAWTPGPQIAIYPPPAVPALQSTTLEPADLEALRAALVERSSLFTGTDYGQPAVADLPSTRVSVDLGDEHWEVDVYALQDLDPAAGLPEDQVQARAELQDLITDLRAIVDGPDRTWELGMTPRIRVSSVPIEPGGEADGPGSAADVQPWPAGVAEPVASGASPFGCVALDGEQRDALLAAAADTNASTPWRLSGGLHHIAIRPLFPGEPDCP